MIKNPPDLRLQREWPVMVALLIVSFIVCAVAGFREATYPGWQDTEAYLGHSLYIAEHGGILGFLRECFAGTFPITERHPLYMLILAPFASRAPEFFRTAKIIDLVFGFVILVTLLWMVTRRYGRSAGLIAGLIYLLSSSLLVASSHVNHEMQFVLCSLWVWWLLTEPEKTPTSAPNASRPGSQANPTSRWRFLLERSQQDGGFEQVTVRSWALAGIWLGLAYLVKSSALLMAVAILVAGVWHFRLSFFAGARFWVLLATALLVSSPLLVRNIRGYGELLYEGVNSNIMWMDKWSELGAEHSVLYYDRYGIVTIDRNGLPTAKDYFSSHAVGEIAGRLFGGVFNELLTVAPKTLKPALPLPYRVGTSWFGLAVIAFALGGLWMRRRSWEAALVFFWSAAFITFFGWNRLFPDIRYLAPLIPVWVAFASYAMCAALQRLLSPVAAWRTVTAVVVATVTVAIGWTVAGGAFSTPQPIMAQSRSYQHLIEWFNRTIEPGDRVLTGPTEEFYGLLWMVDRPISIIMTPETNTLDGFQRYLRDRNVRYIVMSIENAQGQKGQLREALAPYLEVTPEGTLIEKQVLPGWHQVFVDPESKPHFIVYEAVRSAQEASATETRTDNDVTSPLAVSQPRDNAI